MNKSLSLFLISALFGFASTFAANAQSSDTEDKTKRLDEVKVETKGPSSSAAQSGWVEAKSENFLYYAPVSEEKAKKAVQELEFFRTALFRFLGFEESPETLRVEVYAAPNTREIARSVSAGIGGAYVASLDGPKFVLNMNDGSRSRSRRGRRASEASAPRIDPEVSVRRIIFHEYSHHITSTYSSRIYPTWYNEGFAEYLGTMELFEAKDGEPAKIHIGTPQQGRAFALEFRRKWYDWDKLIATEVGYSSDFGGVEAAQFYSQSWLAAHYIHSTPGLGTKMTKYIDLLNGPDTPENAFEVAFEMTPADFGKKVKKYFKKNDYRTLVTTFADGIELAEVKTRPISEGEAAYKRGDMISWFRGDPAANDQIETSLKRALQTGGPRQDIYRAQAMLEARRGNYDEAKTLIAKSLKIDKNHSKALQSAGMIHMAEYQDEDAATEEASVKKARDYFFDAMVANPDNLAAHFHYASTFAELDDKPDQQAVSSAIESALYYRSGQRIEDSLKLAKVLARGGETDAAKYLYTKAATWIEDEDKRKEAEDALEKLN